GPEVAREALERLIRWIGSTVRSRLERVDADVALITPLERDLPLGWAVVDRMAPGPDRAALVCDLTSVELLVELRPSTGGRIARAIGEVAQPGLRARVLLRAGRAVQRVDRDPRPYLEEARALAAEAGDRSIEIQAEIALGIALRHAGALEEAERVL